MLPNGVCLSRGKVKKLFPIKDKRSETADGERKGSRGGGVVEERGNSGSGEGGKSGKVVFLKMKA